MNRAAHRVFALAVVLAVAACKGGGGQVTACTADAQCADGARCLSGMCEYPYRLTMAKPTGRVVTNGAVELQVSAAGGPVDGSAWQPASVELLAADRSLATVGPPDYATTWRPLASEDGTYAVRARVTVDGQVYESLPVTVVVDHVAPAAPGVEAVATPRNDPTLTLTGTAEGGATVAVADGSVRLSSVTAAAGGAWTAQVRLGEGRHGLLVTATDEAGNGSPALGLEVVVDLTPPEAPQIDALASPTALHELTVTGTAEPGSQVQVAEGAAVLGTAASGATGSWSYPAVLANGEHALHALATDAAGNASGPSRTVTVKVDSAKPSAPTLVVATPTSADPVPVTGTADVGTVVRVYEGAAELASAVADAASHWSAALQGLGPGAHVLRAKAFSATQVESDPASATVLVDRTAPAVASRTPVNGASNVWSRDTIVVTFSEPLAPVPQGVSPASLMTQDGTAVPVTWLLSTDGLTLTGRIDVLPPVPNVLTAQLWPGLSDAAGNRVVDAGWSWAIPTWQDLGYPLWYRDTVQVSHGHIAALDAAGAPWVVAAEMSSQANYWALRLFRWTGSAWAELAPWQTSNQRVGAVLDADADGTIAMTWLEMQPTGLLVVAASWNGTAWTPPTVMNVNPAAQAGGASVWASPGGRMVVGWTEDGVPMYAAWDGARWKAVTGLPAQITRASITSTGLVSAYWTEGGYVALSLGPGRVEGKPTPDRGMIVYSPEGRPYAAIGGQLQVRQWGPPDHWEALGGVLNLVSGSDVTPMDVRFAGEAPVVMWKEGGVVMKQWAGVWRPLVHAVDEATAPAANVYSPAGFVATTWTEVIGRDKETALRVKRFNR